MSKFQFPQVTTDTILDRYQGQDFNEIGRDGDRWGWHWELAHKMRIGGIITLPNGRSSFKIIEIRWTGGDVKMLVVRVDFGIPAKETWLDANGYFMYIKPERERQQVIKELRDQGKL